MHALRALFVVTLVASWAMGQTAGAPAGEAEGSCVSCHRDLGGEFAEPVAAEQTSIHSERGLSCADCHGGDPSQADMGNAMNPSAGFVARPKTQDIPRFCGRCHSDPAYMRRFNPSQRIDQETEYHSSVHGQRLRKGDIKVATCISCHGYHGIQPVANPAASVFPTNVAQTCGKCHADASYMKPYSIPTGQVQEYGKSVHANALMSEQDLSAPTCNDCHGNHGAAPPGIDSIANVCGTCHVRQAELFESSPHQSAFAAMQLATCEACHENHEVRATRIEMLGVGEESVCGTCHVADEPGYKAAIQMRASIDGLAERIEQAEQLLQRAEASGMEVSRPLFEIKDARSSLVQARVSVHSFSPAEVETTVKPGLEVASSAYQSGEDALHELSVRRLGMAASLVVILLAVGALYLKIRRMERHT